MLEDKSKILVNEANINLRTNVDSNTDKSSKNIDINSNSNIDEIEVTTNKEDEIKQPILESNSNYLLDYSYLLPDSNIILEPDYYTDEYCYFLSVEKTINKLKESLIETLNKYPIMFEPIKDDLLEYSKKEQKNKFEKKIGFFASLKRSLKLLFNEDQDRKEEKIKAKETAYLLSQLNGHKNKIKEKGECTKYIECFDKQQNKFNVDDDPLYTTIYESLSIEVNNNDYNEYIRQLDQKFTDLKQSISNYQENNKKKILFNYLIRIVNEKIIEIKNSLKYDFLVPENKKILENIRNSLNDLTIQYNYNSNKNVKFFYGLLFEFLYITKNNKNEKEALVTKNSLDSFIKTFEKEYNLLKNELVGGKTENNNKEDYMNFKENCEKNINELEKKRNENEEKINEIGTDSLRESISTMNKVLDVDNKKNEEKEGDKSGEKQNKKNDIANIVEKGGDIILTAKNVINNNNKEKRLNIDEINKKITKWKKLRNIHILLNDIKTETKNIEKYKGLLIYQKIEGNDDSFALTVKN